MYLKREEKEVEIPQHRDQLHVHKVDDMLLGKNCLNTAELTFKKQKKKSLSITNTSQAPCIVLLYIRPV